MRSILVQIMLLLVIIQGCSESKKVDVSGVKIDLSTYDFYQDFRTFDTTACTSETQRLADTYPSFFNFYLDTLMGVGNIDTLNTSLCDKISFLKNNKDLRFLSDTILTVYPNTDKQNAQLKSLFKHIKYYIPEWKVPNIYFFDGGLRLWSVVIYQDYVAIGLDMFLGKDFQYYASRQIPTYMSERMEPTQIPVLTAKALYEDLSKLSIQSATDFLQMMIESGKELLFMRYVLPDFAENELFSLSEEKYKWLEENEAQIYNYFITHDMIYSTVMKDNLKYIQEAPYSPGMPTESPGKTGVYIGYKILLQYIQNTGASLMSTITNQDYQEIFEKSHYKPL